MSKWTFYNAVRDAVRRIADERDKPKADPEPPPTAPKR